MDSNDRRIFEQNVAHVCVRWQGLGDGIWTPNGGPRILHPYIYVCLDRSRVWGKRIRRSESYRGVRRISILAWSSVCSDIWSISIWRTWRVYGSHLLPSHPCRPPSPPTSYPHARLCYPRVMDTQGVGDYANEASRPYGWRFMGRPKGNVIVRWTFFLQIFGRSFVV